MQLTLDIYTSSWLSITRNGIGYGNEVVGKKWEWEVSLVMGMRWDDNGN